MDHSRGGLEVLLEDRMGLHMYAVPVVSDAVLVKMYMLKCNL